MKSYIIATFAYKKLTTSCFILLLCCFAFSPLTAQITDSLILKQRQERLLPTRTPRAINTVKPTGSIAINRDPTYSSMSLEQLVQDVFVKTGTCVTIDNVTSRIYGWNEATKTWSAARGLAYFNKSDSDFPLDEGLVLSTGNVCEAEGPNKVISALEGGLSYTTGVPGDADLQAILNKQSISATVTNVGILEFDFVPTGTTMEFIYIFASEEYPYYVNSGFNDVFAFFVNKVGDPVKTNIALLPKDEADDPNILEVSINNVNNGKFVNYNYTGTVTPPIRNSKFFIPNPLYSVGTELNGYTVKLTAKYTGMVPCKKYHLKLAIANAGDNRWGSAVFLGAKSFDAGDKLTIYGNSIEGMERIFKTCDQNYFRVTRTETSNQAVTVELSYEGTAINGTHYTQLDGTPLPESVVIPANKTYTDVWFKAKPSAVSGSYFDVILYCPCKDMSVAATKRVYIYDFSTFTSATPTSTCSNSSNGTITVASSGGSGVYEYSINNGTTWQISNVFSGLAQGGYTVLARDVGSCQTPASKTVTVGQIIANAGTDITRCNNATFTMNGSQPKTGETGTWAIAGVNPGLTIANPSLYNTTVTMTAGKTVTLRWTVSNGICSSSDDVVLKNNIIPTATTSSSNVTCYGGNNGSITVTASGGSGVGYQYSKDNGATWQSSSTFTNLFAGDYSIFVKDNTQCTSLVKNVTITQPVALLSSTDISTSVICANTIAYVTVSNSKSGITYKVYTVLSGGTPISSLSGNGASISLSAGTLTTTQTFYVEATNGTCTSARFAITVTVKNQAVAATITAADVTVCPNTIATLTASAAGVTSPVVFRWYNSQTSPTVISTNSTLTIPNLSATTTYYVSVEGTNYCENLTGSRKAVTANIIETLLVYPDIRILACPQNTINLSKYIDILDFGSIKWTAAPLNTVSVNINGIINNATQLKQGNTYTYFYEIQNSCPPAKTGVLYLTVPKNYAIETDLGELKICYENASAIQLNQIFGIESDNGAWACTPPAASTHLNISAIVPHAGAAIFNGKAAWSDGAIAFDGNGNKVITVTYKPAAGTCFAGNTYTLKIILTNSIN